jgi:hypothetical protein
LPIIIVVFVIMITMMMMMMMIMMMMIIIIIIIMIAVVGIAVPASRSSPARVVHAAPHRRIDAARPAEAPSRLFGEFYRKFSAGNLLGVAVHRYETESSTT